MKFTKNIRVSIIDETIKCCAHIVRKLRAGVMFPDNVGATFNWYLIKSAFAVIFAFAIIPAAANPKQRVEQEFRRLETAVARCVYEDVLTSPDMESMSRALYNFMQDNPSVARILRTNAGGYTVNDVNSDSPRSAPPRDVSGQRWFRDISQNRRAYYSMNADSVTNDITLFYAWPLMTGPDSERFSGAFAAIIDFTSQLALVEAGAPFQIAFRGRPLFQHEWDGGSDYNESPLEVRGTSGLTIRTARPHATRLDPHPARTGSAKRSDHDDADESARDIDGYETDDDAEDPIGNARRTARAPGSSFINTGIFILLLLIAVMLAYLIVERLNVKDNRPRPPQINRDKIVVRSMSEKAAETSPQAPISAATEVAAKTATAKTVTPAPLPTPLAPPPALPSKDADNAIDILADVVADPAGMDMPAISVNKVAEGGLYKEKDQNQVMNKMMKLIKEEFIRMDKKINLLAQRVVELEKRD